VVLTPFHVVPVWPLYVRWPDRWDVLGLSFGAVMSDLEIVTVYPIVGTIESGRGIMHSLLGVFTVNLLLAVVAARYLVPWLATRLDRRFPGKGWRRFAGRDIVADRKTLPVTIGSAVLGGLTHLAVDVFMHSDTPLLWPWRSMPLAAVPWATDPVWDVVLQLLAGGAFFVMTWKWLGR
jgi:membrane-bound metal-dependent hydrolase YbcI (DUF457 family)